MIMQSTVRTTQTTGLAGEIAREAPFRAEPLNCLTGGGGSPNIFGRIYTQPSDGDAALGGTDPVVGMLVMPKEHALVGAAGSALDPVNALADGVVGEFALEGILYADLTTSATKGDVLTYDTTDGSIGNDAPDGTHIVFGAKAYHDISAPGLAIIHINF